MSLIIKLPIKCWIFQCFFHRARLPESPPETDSGGGSAGSPSGSETSPCSPEYQGYLQSKGDGDEPIPSMCSISSFFFANSRRLSYSSPSWRQSSTGSNSECSESGQSCFCSCRAERLSILQPSAYGNYPSPSGFSGPFSFKWKFRTAAIESRERGMPFFRGDFFIFFFTFF